MSTSTVCSSHAACVALNATTYCASISDGSGRCRPCAECALFADAIDGACPTGCAGVNGGTGTGAANGDELFNAYAYWRRVRDVGFGSGASAPGCESAAIEATKTTTGAKKGRTSCAPVFTKKANGAWCDMTTLTSTFPYKSCIASSANGYCGVGEPSVCVRDGYFDCCPTKPGAIAGVSVAVGVVLLVLQYFIYRSCYTRKLIKREDDWKDPRLQEAAEKAAERHPKLAERIRAKSMKFKTNVNVAPAEAPTTDVAQP